jgi:hypothetical protein
VNILGRFIALLLFFFLSDIRFSYANNLSYKIDGFVEDYSEDVNVSGGILTAFQFGSINSFAQFDNLFVANNENTKNLKIKILSIDGKYSAEFALNFLSNENSWVQVSFPTQYKEKISKYKPEDISVYAFQETVSKRNKKEHVIYPTSWGEPDDSIQKFYLNSAGDFARFAYLDINKGKEVIFCEPIINVVKTSFNYVCVIPKEAEIKNNIVIFTTTPDSKGKKYKVWKPK